MLNATLTVPQWLSLPIDIRMRLVKVFHIPRSQGSLVQDNKVMSDGYTHNDLALITVEKMQKLLDTDQADFYQLLEQVIASFAPPVEQEVIEETKALIPWIGEVPKDFTLNIGGKEYVLVEKKERLGIVTPNDLKKVIGADEPKKTRGRPRKKK